MQIFPQDLVEQFLQLFLLELLVLGKHPIHHQLCKLSA